ncbi:MAG TPA: hypothetical protein DCY75_02190 [Clostridiales bacterium]|nr:hypothetical protein [Clostridiales bacterium]
MVEHALHTKDIRKMGGLAKTMPVTAIAFMLCAFSVMGIPPFSGFFAKYLVIEGILASDNVVLGILFIVGAVMTIMYLMRLFVKVFLGPPAEDAPPVKEGTPVMVISVLILGLASLLLGMIMFLPSQLATMVGGVL